MKLPILAFFVGLMFLPAFIVGNGPKFDWNILKREVEIAQARGQQVKKAFSNVGDRVSTEVGQIRDNIQQFVNSFDESPEATAQVDAQL